MISFWYFQKKMNLILGVALTDTVPKYGPEKTAF